MSSSEVYTADNVRLRHLCQILEFREVSVPCVGSVVPSLIWSASRRRAHGAVSVCQVKRMAVVYLEETNLIKTSLVFWLRPQEAVLSIWLSLRKELGGR